MQSIAAATCDGIIKRKLQVVISQEPVERRPSFASPPVVTRHPVSLQTSRHCASGFNGLLIETCLFAALVIKALRTNGYEMTVGFAMLRRQEPIQCFEAGGNHPLI